MSQTSRKSRQAELHELEEQLAEVQKMLAETEGWDDVDPQAEDVFVHGLNGSRPRPVGRSLNRLRRKSSKVEKADTAPKQPKAEPDNPSSTFKPVPAPESPSAYEPPEPKVEVPAAPKLPKTRTREPRSQATRQPAEPEPEPKKPIQPKTNRPLNRLSAATAAHTDVQQPARFAGLNVTSRPIRREPPLSRTERPDQPVDEIVGTIPGRGNELALDEGERPEDGSEIAPARPEMPDWLLDAGFSEDDWSNVARNFPFDVDAFMDPPDDQDDAEAHFNRLIAAGGPPPHELDAPEPDLPHTNLPNTSDREQDRRRVKMAKVHAENRAKIKALKPFQGDRTEDRKSLADGESKTSAWLGGGGSAAYLMDIGGRRAVFKPDIGVEHLDHAEGGHYEAAASDVCEILGLNFVPPTVVRKAKYTDRGTGQDVEGYGSAQSFVDDSDVAAEHYPSPTAYDGDDLPMATAFDYLIGNYDRHSGNWMIPKSDRPMGEDQSSLEIGRSPPALMLLIDNRYSQPETTREEVYGKVLPGGLRVVHSKYKLQEECWRRDLAIPRDVKNWRKLWPKIEQALREHHMKDGAIDLCRKRLEDLVGADTFRNLVAESGVSLRAIREYKR